MGYRTRQLEMEIRLLKEELHNLQRTVDILERQHVAKTKYGTTLSPFHKDVMPKVETCNGEVEYVDLVKFVVDKKPLEFKVEDKELIKEVYPDGSVLDVVKDKEKKTLYMAPKTVPYYGPRKDDKSEEYLRQIDSMYARIKKEYGW